MAPEQLDLLSSSDGQQLLGELAGRSIDADDELRLIMQLRARFAPELVAAAVAQAKLRQRARAKFSRADQMYFTPAGLEQASTERMARYHAARFAAFGRIADLCCGVGGDLVALAGVKPVRAVDVDPVHLRMAVLNAGAYHVAQRVEPVLADVQSLVLDDDPGLALFIDPARRVDGRRLRGGETLPPLDWCFARGEMRPVLIKAGPALPLDVVPPAWGIEFVSEGRELKESLLSSPAMARPGRRATVLSAAPTEADPSGWASVSLEAMPGEAVAVASPGRFLLDPDPAVTRAGLVEDLARGLAGGSVWKLDPEIAFLSSDAPMVTPFGRCLRVESSEPWNLKRLQATLRSLDVGSVDIRKRGSAVDVESVQRRLRLTGARAATVVLTRVMGEPWALVCVDA